MFFGPFFSFFDHSKCNWNFKTGASGPWQLQTLQLKLRSRETNLTFELSKTLFNLVIKTEKVEVLFPEMSPHKPGSHLNLSIRLKGKTNKWIQACDIRIVISVSVRSWSKHKPRTEQKTKQRKILAILPLAVPEDMSCFVFVSILFLCLCRSCEPGHKSLRPGQESYWNSLGTAMRTIGGSLQWHRASLENP